MLSTKDVLVEATKLQPSVVEKQPASSGNKSAIKPKKNENINLNPGFETSQTKFIEPLPKNGMINDNTDIVFDVYLAGKLLQVGTKIIRKYVYYLPLVFFNAEKKSVQSIAITELGQLAEKEIAKEAVKKMAAKEAITIESKYNSKSLTQVYEELVEKATQKYGGNVTVQRNGVDLFRVHQTSSGHGFKVTQFKNNIGKNGKVFKNPIEVKVRKTHVKQLERALKGDPNYSIRTRKGNGK